MPETCCCPPEAGNASCDLLSDGLETSSSGRASCPDCGQAGKPVANQTVKAMLSVSLRSVQDGDYYFCHTATCPVVYFTPEGEPSFSTSQVRERVYQKEPRADDVWVCYCFGLTAGEIRKASPELQESILTDISTGIRQGQCACELRNPTGSCCLGTVRALMRA